MLIALSDTQQSLIQAKQFLAEAVCSTGALLSSSAYHTLSKVSFQNHIVRLTEVPHRRNCDLLHNKPHIHKVYTLALSIFHEFYVPFSLYTMALSKWRSLLIQGS